MRTLISAILSFSATTAFANMIENGGKPDPMARLNSVVDELKAHQRQCETRLLPVPVHGNLQTASGRIGEAISSLATGETLLMNDPDMLSGRQPQWLNLLNSAGLRVLGLRSVEGFARMQVLVQRAEPAEAVLSRILVTAPVAAPEKFGVKYFKSRRRSDSQELVALEPGVLAFPYYIEDGRLKVLLRPERAGLPITESLNEVAGNNYAPQPIQIPVTGNEDPEHKVVSLLKAVMPGHLSFRIRRTRNVIFSAPDSVMNPIPAIHIPLKTPVQRRFFDWEVWDVQSLLPRLQETAAADGRLELSLHRLIQEARAVNVQWLGEPLRFENVDRRVRRHDPNLPLPNSKIWKRRNWFLPAESAKWKFVSADVQDVNAQGGQTAVRQVEFAVSRLGSSNIISFLPVRKINGQVWVGLLQEDSPALQFNGENARYWTIPTMRLFHGETNLETAVRDARRTFENRFDLKVKSVQPLGASFRPDPDATSDLLYPYVAEVDAGEYGDEKFNWWPLEALVGKFAALRDARLELSIMRLHQAPKF